jgi:hypothetical protein
MTVIGALSSFRELGEMSLTNPSRNDEMPVVPVAGHTASCQESNSI